MSVNNLDKLFQSSVRISNVDPMHRDAIWPHNIDICITRVPIRKRDGYSEELMERFARRLKSCMVTNGVVFLVCYAPIECKYRPFEVAKYMVDAGFHHVDNIIIEKSWFPGKRSEVNLVNSHEYVLYFCNGKVWHIDRIPILEYLKMDEDAPCPGNTWKVVTGSLEDSISGDLAELLLRFTGALPGSVVFDPFMGNKSTLLASSKLGHSFIGFEKNKARLKRYKKLLENPNR